MQCCCEGKKINWETWFSLSKSICLCVFVISKSNASISTAQTTGRKEGQGMVSTRTGDLEHCCWLLPTPVRQREPTGTINYWRTSAEAWSDIPISLPTITITIPARPGAGKLPVAAIGIGCQFYHHRFTTILQQQIWSPQWTPVQWVSTSPHLVEGVDVNRMC